VQEPGAFFTCDLGGSPIVVVRDREARLRAFLNVCRHRGSLVCEGEGRRETLQCPYHAWTYELDGSLRAAPRSDREPGFDKDALGLVPAAVDAWGPFVFVNPDAETGPLAETLGELPELVAAAGIELESLRFLQRTGGEYEANWKVCSENFLECYHCQVAHPGFSKVVDVSVDAYVL
jgi:choline monooxygenase